jgi:xylulokinase
VFLGIDLGQSAVKVTALRPGHPPRTVAAPYPSATPQPGWIEQDPADWVAAMIRSCQDIMGVPELAGPAKPPHVAGVCVTGATHHGVLLDASGEVLRPVITMRDLRSAEIASRLRREHLDLILGRTRNAPDAAWTLPHLMWVRNLEPSLWLRIDTVLFGKDYLVHALTGAQVTDEVEAEGSLLWNAHRQRWDPDLLDLAGLAEQCLPQVVPPSTPVGQLTPGMAVRTGIPAGTPVFAGCSDTAAEAYAAGARAPGATVIKLASSGNVNLVTSEPLPDLDWVTYSHVLKGLSYHAVPTTSAASAFGWLRNVIDPAGGVPFESLDAEAGQVGPGSDGALFVPYLGGVRSPRWDPRRRAAFARLDPAHGRGHLARAVYEGVAYAMRDSVQVLLRHGGQLGTPFIIGGGAQSAVWRQVIADVLGAPLVHPPFPDASVGAAMLAYRGLTGADLSPGQSGTPMTIQPSGGSTALVYNDGYRAYKALRDGLRAVDGLGQPAE